MFLRGGCAAVLCLVAAGCVQKDEPIVAGTALMQCAVQDLIPEAAISPALIPPGSCPGHYDMRPGDIRRVAACNALLLHTWQETKPNITSVVRASGIPPENVLVVPVPGNWMVPDAYADALESLAALLESKELGTQNLAARAEQRISEVRISGRRLQNRLQTAGAPNTVVLCQNMVVPFVEWAGFSVAGAFGRSEDLSVSDVEALVKLGKARGVSLVIDNLQSGDEKTGEALARELGAERVIISNFPGGLPNTNTWDRALARNTELLLEALDRLRLPSS
ncbi:MAG: zinc ABC transporter substrate-binding protein [Candidatus Hydrogenedentota bacterium]